MNQSAPPLGQEYKRRSERVLLRIPIQVKGKDSEGNPFTENTSTLVINRNGARINLRHRAQINDRITITNFQTEKTCPFRVVGQIGQSLGEGPEWGVECLEQNLIFWGIMFPEKVAPKFVAPAAKEMVDALLECSACQFRELAQLTMEQYRSLSANSSISRRCTHCDKPTDWGFGFVEGDTEKVPTTPGADASSSEEAERRRARRMTVKLPILIRVPGGSEEVTRTENLSKTGVCFASSQTLAMGEIINLTVGYTPGGNASEVAARVVWRRQLDGPKRSLYGVHIEESR